MDYNKLSNLINKVIPKKGSFRTPSFWINKILIDVITKSEFLETLIISRDFSNDFNEDFTI